jgi:hypothetical protein
VLLCIRCNPGSRLSACCSRSTFTPVTGSPLPPPSGRRHSLQSRGLASYRVSRGRHSPQSGALACLRPGRRHSRQWRVLSLFLAVGNRPNVRLWPLSAPDPRHSRQSRALVSQALPRRAPSSQCPALAAQSNPRGLPPSRRNPAFAATLGPHAAPREDDQLILHSETQSSSSSQELDGAESEVLRDPPMPRYAGARETHPANQSDLARSHGKPGAPPLRRTIHCGYCKQAGHSKKTCPERPAEDRQKKAKEKGTEGPPSQEPFSRALGLNKDTTLVFVGHYVNLSDYLSSIIRCHFNF